jgi:hypothetical protein
VRSSGELRQIHTAKEIHGGRKMSNKEILVEFMEWLQNTQHINRSEERRKGIVEEFIVYREEYAKKKEAEYFKRYKETHPEQYCSYREKWEKNNPEKVKEKRKRYREKNREKMREYYREYRKRKKLEESEDTE